MSQALPAHDTVTMLRRNLRHIQRYPSLTLMLLAQPVLILLLFVFVFGETLGAGVRPDLAAGGRAAYLDYVVPGVLLFAIAGVGLGTAISVAADRTKGITSRFRTMGITRSSVLAGEVLGSMVQAAFVLVAVSLVAALLGYRPGGTAVGWVAAFALALAVAFAVIWICLALGLNSRSVETASNTPPAADRAHVPQQRLRAGRLLPGGAALVRRAPAVHTHDRGGPRAARRHTRGCHGDHCPALVRCPLPGRLPLGPPALRA